MIEKNFDIPFIADLALREKQIQQNYRPIIAVHKWFARRPGTLFRGLLLSEFSSLPLREAFYRANNLKDLRIADPFMGGGTPLLEANRLGCQVVGFDINPMSYWIVKQEIEHLDLGAYDVAVESLGRKLEKEIGHLYQTECVLCGKNVPAKYFLWVKVTSCSNCRKDIDLFPGYLLAADRRHPKNVFVCSACGQLTETGDRKNPGNCRHCGVGLSVNGPAGRPLAMDADDPAAGICQPGAVRSSPGAGEKEKVPPVFGPGPLGKLRGGPVRPDSARRAFCGRTYDYPKNPCFRQGPRLPVGRQASRNLFKRFPQDRPGEAEDRNPSAGKKELLTVSK
jgi:hypothetical protein